MNLSGNAVRYWLQKENIDQTRLLVVVDDLSIPLGDFRLEAATALTADTTDWATYSSSSVNSTPVYAWASVPTSSAVHR